MSKSNQIRTCAILIIFATFCNSCCKYVVKPAKIILKFPQIAQNEFEQLIVNTDKNSGNFSISKNYNSNNVEIEFLSDPLINSIQIFTKVTDSTFVDTLINVQSRMIKESKKCGDDNQLGTSFLLNNQNYNFDAWHEVIIKK